MLQVTILCITFSEILLIEIINQALLIYRT